jgi:hypothetical protein
MMIAAIATIAMTAGGVMAITAVVPDRPRIRSLVAATGVVVVTGNHA